MTITKNTIIAEILNNDPTQGCVPIFPVHRYALPGLHGFPWRDR